MKKYILTLILLAILPLTACGTTGPVNLATMNSPVPNGKARVIVTRDTSMLYLAAAADVRSNGYKIASLGRGGSVAHDIPKGNNVLSVSTLGSFGSYTINFDAKAGRIYNFAVAPNGSAIMTGSLFGMAGDAVKASIADQSGYFQIMPIN